MNNSGFINSGYFYQEHIMLDVAGEKHRAYRLQRVIGYAQAQIDHDHSLLNKVSKLKDHKGILTIYWVSEPTQDEKKAFESAWYSRIGDGSEVEHEIEV